MWFDHIPMFAGSLRAGEIADGPEQKNRVADVRTQQSLRKKLNLGVFSGQLLCVCALHVRRSTLFLKWCSDGCLFRNIFKQLQHSLDRVRRQRRDRLLLWVLLPVACSDADGLSARRGSKHVRHILLRLEPLSCTSVHVFVLVLLSARLGHSCGRRSLKCACASVVVSLNSLQTLHCNGIVIPISRWDDTFSRPRWSMFHVCLRIF